MDINLYEFIRGPLLSLVLILVAGLHIFRIFQFFHATSRLPDNRSATRPPKDFKQRLGGLMRSIPAGFRKFRTHFRNTIFGMNPVAVWTAAVYHLIIFAAFFFVEGHNVLLDISWGTSLPSLPEGFIDSLTAILLGISLFYLIRRGVVGRFHFPVIAKDYLAIIITAAPFATGFMAYHQWFDYNTIIICHMLSGVLFFLMLPFSKMGHLIFFVFGRFYLNGELSLTRGRRVWKSDFLIKKLPPSSTENGVDVAYIKYMLDQKKTQMKVMMTFCARCSNCAESCFMYANTGDPSYIPSHKVFHSIGTLYRKKGKVTRRDLEEMADTVWNKCVLCERCYCPVGLKIPEMISLGRSICRSQGVYKTYDSFSA
jgi:ferredoxin